MYVFTYGLEDVKTEFDYAQFRYFMQNYQYSSPKPSADFRMARSDVTPPRRESKLHGRWTLLKQR